jgi:hypothetical protein
MDLCRNAISNGLENVATFSIAIPVTQGAFLKAESLILVDGEDDLKEDLWYVWVCMGCVY